MAISLEADTWTLSRSDADKSYSINRDPSKALDLSSAKKFQVEFWWKVVVVVVGGVDFSVVVSRGLSCAESVLCFH